MAQETEVKIYGIDAAAVRKRLKEHGAEPVKNVLQHNEAFRNSFTKEWGVALRVREEGKNAILTVKGPKRIINGCKVREEHELPVDAKTARAMLKLLGFQKFLESEMKREYYDLYDCSVEICRLPGIPPYLEIEGSERNIKRVAALLGYTPQDYSSENAWKRYKIDGTRLVFRP